MRLTTLASAAVLALSTAAIAQVGQAPEEQKLASNAGAPDDTDHAEAQANAAAASERGPGAPSTALVNSVADADPTTRPVE